MSIRLNKAIKEFGVGLQSITDLLKEKGAPVATNDPNQKLDDKQYELLKSAFSADKSLRSKAEEQLQDRQEKKRSAKTARKAESQMVETVVPEVKGPHIVGHIDLDAAEQTSAANNAKSQKSDNNKKDNKKKPQADAAAAKTSQATNTKAETEEAVKASANDSTPSNNPLMTQDKNGNQPKNTRPSVEERAKAIGEEENGVFKLRTQTEISGPKVLGTIDLSAINSTTRPKKKSKDERRRDRNKNNNGGGQNGGGQAQGNGNGQRKKRNRIGTERVDVNNAANQPKQNGNNNGKKRNNNNGNNGGGNNQNRNNQNGQGNNSKSNNKNRNRRAKEQQKPEVTEEDVAKQVKETLARLTSKQKGSKGAKYRKEKREQQHARAEEERREAKAESKVLKLTEFVTANELAQMMDVPVTKVIGTCMSIGIMVSINQRMDAETIDLVAEEFGYKTEYVAADVQEAIAEEVDAPEDLEPRAPIVTVMGHVDHGKTSLLDYVRKSNVIAGEAGGITQHIGAYNVTLENGRHITFLDTPGHEAFTAMRARGAQVTDIAIIIIAADDDIMPQTKEAIAHATAANVPIVFAINKVDKPHANPDKIKEGLAAMNFLVEEWGGKYQSQDISAKKGIGVAELLDKVLLEADMLELKANPHRKATGSIIESSLDKGRGYVATLLVDNGTLHVGDIILAGTHYGKVKAMFNERNQRIQEAGPSSPALILGLNGAPTAGDKFNVMDTDQEARQIANKREQLQRELGLRTQKRFTLEDIARRKALGEFHELNVIVKGDVDGSIEALSDSLLKLSTPEVQVNVVHKAVGAISESDVTLAAASNAYIIGFQVRPSADAKRLAAQEGVDIRIYSIIYDAIEEVKSAMEGMLAPDIKEEVIGNVMVKEVYHISKVGTIAGAMVMDGKIKRNCKVRVIRDGIVRYTGALASLKRFKDDVKEVTNGFECGLSIAGYNDILPDDMLEAFEEVEVHKSL